MISLLKKQPFFYVYVGLVAPSYVLPLIGSNSFFANLFYKEANFAFYLHFFTLLLAVCVSFIKAIKINMHFLVVLPVLAMCFDLVPILNLIPLIPTALHILTLLLATQTSISVSAVRAYPFTYKNKID